MTDSEQLLENIYYMCVHSMGMHLMMKNDLSRDNVERARSDGYYEAYAYVKQMMENPHIGMADYKTVFDMKEPSPFIFN